MEWYSAVNYIFASTLQILLLKFVPTFQEKRKLHHLSHGPLICSCSLWKKSLPMNSHNFWSQNTKLQLSGGQASTLLKPFSACHPPAGMFFLIHWEQSQLVVQRPSCSTWQGWAAGLPPAQAPCWGTTKRPRESSEDPFLVLLQRILSYPNTRRHTACCFHWELFLETGVLLFEEDTMYFGTVYISVTYANRASTIALLQYLILKHVERANMTHQVLAWSPCLN